MSWPGGAKLAFWIANNVEHYEFTPPANPHRQFWTRTPAPDVMQYALRDYGNRVGFWRLLDALDSYDVPVTASVNLGVLEAFPEIREAIISRGWDILSHGIYNTSFVYGMSVDEERAWVGTNIELVKKHVGSALTGLFGPGASLSPNSMEVWAEAGINHVVDWFVDDQPFPLLTSRGKLVNIPYSWEVNDARVMGGAAFGGLYEVERFVQMCRDHFDML
ncbi:MAG TPA: polysaccharide deacetylase family protein, partial [Gemmatimonadales bacterium]|nr:polysaccharide deacetylase family protein [Gemmatimonadales bacterium]